MIYYDLHSHRSSQQAEDVTIVSVDLCDQSSLLSVGIKNIHTGYYSAGVHPWYIDKTLVHEVRKLALLPSVVAIGETGLDKITAAGMDDFKLQQELFIEHIALSEKVKKPLIIHCVKAWDELLHIRKTTKPVMPWIIHGFRSKATLAGQLLNAGIYLSFGALYNVDSLKAAWEKRLLLAETDEARIDIRDIYARIANKLDITVEDLSDEIGAFFIHKLLPPFEQNRR